MIQGESRELRVPVTRADVVRYSGASTDFNEIHFLDRRARAIGLPGVVAHGMWTMGAALRAVTDWVGDPARILAYQVRFTKPVVVPDTDEGAEVVVVATVQDVVDEVATVGLAVTCDGDAVLGAARVRVHVGEEPR